MGKQTTKRTFEVPVRATHDGTLDIYPFFQRSPIFSGAGGYAWSISYYPESLYGSDSIDLCLQLEYSNGAAVTISSSVALIDPAPTAGSLPPLVLVEESPPMELHHDDESRRMVTHWVPKSTLSKVPAQYMTLDSKLVFQWTITVISVTPAPKPLPVPVPMLTPVPKVLATDMAATAAASPKAAATDVEPAVKPDVTYSVGGDLFHTHKFILAARSPVFTAELSATTTGASQAPATIIEVADMLPDVFDALLHYIYTDTLPSTEGEADDDDDEDECQMMCNLLVAADRYGVEGLKLLCEGKLSEMLDVENVAEMLGFADDHYCSRLKDACVQFMVASGRMEEVVASHGYQRLRLKRPSILVDVYEKSFMKRKV